MSGPGQRIPTLFFDEKGCGPDACDLALHPMAELKDGDKVIAARSVGLRVFVPEEHPRNMGAFLFAVAGGYQLFEEQARELRDQLTAWLDAPRIEARKNPTVVHVDEEAHLCLLSTAAGEWCIAEHQGGPDPETAMWFDTEDAARRAYLEERDLGACELCKAEVAVDDLAELGEDGPRACEACYAQAIVDFKAADMEHAEPSGCDWRGKGVDTATNDEREPICPKCGECVIEALGEIAEPEDVDG